MSTAQLTKAFCYLGVGTWTDGLARAEGLRMMRHTNCARLMLMAVWSCGLPTWTGAGHVQTATQEPDDVRQLRQAAEAGDARAQYDLGVRFASGKGVAASDAEAARWIALAAAQGLVD